jgi:peptidoglycan/xylan/chitin deacetylase (PgdA/CDA1 family)
VEGLGEVRWQDDLSQRQALERIRARVEALEVNVGATLVEQMVGQLKPSGPRSAVMCSWDELRSLAAEGVMLGAHTRTHAILGKLPLEQARQEIIASRDDLKRETGQTPLLFCYPNGLHGTFNADTERLVREAGFAAAFVSLKGFNAPRARNLYQLRRVGVNRRTMSGAFRTNLIPAILQLRQKAGWL